MLVLVLEVGELGFQRRALPVELSPSLVDVADQFLVDLVGYIEGPDEVLAVGVGLGDGALECGDSLGAGAAGGLVEGLEVGVEQFVAVRTEDPGGQELRNAHAGPIADAEWQRLHAVARDVQDGILRTRFDVSRVSERFYRWYRSNDDRDFADTVEGHRQRLAGLGQ